MKETRNIAQIIDTSVFKMTGRPPYMEKGISDTLDRYGKYKVCDELYHEGKRITTISSIMASFNPYN